MQRTDIEWCTHSWNPTSGCSKGCSYCYARDIAHRFKRSFAPTCHPEKLDEPSHVRKPARIFVDSAGDLFDPAIPFRFIAQAFGGMHSAPKHQYFILTKRAERMKEFISWFKEEWLGGKAGFGSAFPREYPHVWLGVSVTNQHDADERIPLLLEVPAARRFVSVEPLLSGVDLYRFLGLYEGDAGRLDWVVVGRQTGPGAKEISRAWVETIYEQCRISGVPLFMKNSLAGAWNPLQQDMP